MSTYSELARTTASQRVIAIETQQAPAYWVAVGDYAAQVDSKLISERQAQWLVKRAVKRAAQ